MTMNRLALDSSRSMPHTMREAYRIANWVLLLLSLYALCFPRLSPQLAKFFPAAISTCWYHARTGKPCPFCGMTRDIGRFTVGDFVQARQLNALSLPFFFLFIFELLWRALLLFSALRHLPILRLIGIDIGMHALFVLTTLFLSFQDLLTI